MVDYWAPSMTDCLDFLDEYLIAWMTHSRCLATVNSRPNRLASATRTICRPSADILCGRPPRAAQH